MFHIRGADFEIRQQYQLFWLKISSFPEPLQANFMTVSPLATTASFQILCNSPFTYHPTTLLFIVSMLKA
jgi:hypothetical protein